MLQVAHAIRESLGLKAAKVPTRQLQDWLVRIMALFNPTAKRMVGELGKVRAASNKKAKRSLGWSPRSSEEAVVASAETLLALPE